MRVRRAVVITTALLAVVLIAHAPELAGMVSCDPLAAFSGLGIGTPAQILPGQCYIDGNVGATMQALGHRAAEDWLHLRLPWWNPFAGFGFPLAAEMQPAAFFLPFVLLLHFASGILLLKMSMQLLAGLCMFACLSSLRLTRAAALTGAVLYALNGTFAWFGDAPMLPIPFLPLLIYGIERSRTAGQFGGAIAIALAIGFSVVAGFPETAFFDGVLALGWCALIFAELQNSSRWSFLGRIALGGLLGLCLAAPALVPFLDGLTREIVMMHRFASLDILNAGQAAVLLVPTAFGPPYADGAMSPWGQTGGYLGVGLILPALCAMIAMRDRRALRLLLCAWIVFWVCVFVRVPLAYRVWRAMPLLNTVEVTRYSMPSLEFAGTVLAALAVDDWCRGTTRHAAYGAFAILSVLLGVALTASLWGRGNWHGEMLWKATVPSFMWAFFLAAALAWLFTTKPRGGRRHVVGGLIAADAMLSFIIPELAGSRPVPLDPGPTTYLASHAGLSRTYNMGRVLGPNYGSYFGIATIRAFDQPMPQNWSDYIARMDPRLNLWLANLGGLPSLADMLLSNLAAFEAAGTRYVLVEAAADPFADRAASPLHQVFRSPTSRVYELPAPRPYYTASPGACRLTVGDREHVQADCASPALLCRLEADDPGWHATVNGTAVPMTTTGDIFQQVALPAGTSRVVFSYAPPYSPLIWSLFAIGLTGLAGLFLRGRIAPRVQWPALPRPGRIVHPLSTP